MGHYLRDVISEVDKTHPRLGNLAAMCQLAIKAKKLLLVVSPRGCGKSRVTSIVALSLPNASLQDRISTAGLAYLKEEFNGFQSVLMVDDIAKCQTQYARISTVTTIAELVYSHYCKSALQGSNFSIENFHGSAVINIQPVLLKEVVKSDEWEASVQDKSIRYYHLYRPQKPNSSPLSFKWRWGISLENVEPLKIRLRLGNKTFRSLADLISVQWGNSRLLEHLADLLMASAALDERNKVNQTDITLLRDLLMPLSYESLVMNKREFESDRYLDSNMLAILTEWLTYGAFTLQQLSDDYKLSVSQCYRIMHEYAAKWIEVSKSPTKFAPSLDFAKQLAECGIK